MDFDQYFLLFELQIEEANFTGEKNTVNAECESVPICSVCRGRTCTSPMPLIRCTKHMSSYSVSEQKYWCASKDAMDVRPGKKRGQWGTLGDIWKFQMSPIWNALAQKEWWMVEDSNGRHPIKKTDLHQFLWKKNLVPSTQVLEAGRQWLTRPQEGSVLGL